MSDPFPQDNDPSDFLCVFVCCVLQVAEQLMTIAYESGVNLFDTAEVYAAGK